MSDIHAEMRVWRKHLRESRLKNQKFAVIVNVKNSQMTEVLSRSAKMW